uniref:Uncharacterized protein n=1 Tax=Eutreptiella gymnastica TaxID=73025 RepID=A0A7S4GB21_9EUGL
MDVPGTRGVSSVALLLRCGLWLSCVCVCVRVCARALLSSVCALPAAADIPCAPEHLFESTSFILLPFCFGRHKSECVRARACVCTGGWEATVARQLSPPVHKPVKSPRGGPGDVPMAHRYRPRPHPVNDTFKSVRALTPPLRS